MLFGKRFSDEEEKFFRESEPLVLMGRGHSGTRIFSVFCETLGYNLDAGNKMSTGDASDIRFTNEIKKIALDFLSNGITSKNTNRLKRATLRYHKGLSGDKEKWGWKFPETYLIGPLVREVFPRAKYLHIIRDGRDIAFKRHQTDRIDRPLGKKIIQEMSVQKESHFIHAAASWKFQVDAFDKWKTEIENGCLHEVKFESFLRDPIIEGKGISEFLKEEFGKDQEDFLNKEIDPNKLSQHKEENAQELNQVSELIADTLRRWKYLD